MKHPLGVCSWTFGPTPLPDIARSLSTLGYDGVELHGDLVAFEPRATKALMDAEGLSIFSLTPDNVDLAHPDAPTRQSAVDYYKRLVDFAASVGGAIVSVHGYVGRIAPLSSMCEERALLVGCVQRIAEHAAGAGVNLVFEVLNRYESHLINTGEAALALVRDVGANNLRVLLDAYHMNIEERDLGATVREVGSQLGLLHVADSNRDAVGNGHTRFSDIFSALQSISYVGPIIVECTPPGPNPFTPVKDESSGEKLLQQLRVSHERLMAMNPT